MRVMLEGLLSLVEREDQFEVNGRRSTVLGIIPPRIVDERLIGELKMQLMRYLNPAAAEGATPSDYCLDFSKVNYFSTAAIGGMRVFNKVHRELRGSPVALIADSGSRAYQVFEKTRLTSEFNLFYTLEDYKRSIGAG